MAETGNKIIEGLREAIRGDFARVTIDGVTWVRATTPMMGEEFESNLALAINDAMCAATDEGKKTTTEVTARILADPNVRAILSRLPATGEYKLPCDVHLPPCTYIRKGCSLDALLVGIREREKFPEDQTVFPHVATSQSTERDRALDEAAQWHDSEADHSKRQYADLDRYGTAEDAAAWRSWKDRESSHRYCAAHIRTMKTSAAARTRSNAADMEG